MVANLISLKDFANQMQKSISTVKTWKNRQNIPPHIFFKIGGCVFVRKDLFEQWVLDKGEDNAGI